MGSFYTEVSNWTKNSLSWQQTQNGGKNGGRNDFRAGEYIIYSIYSLQTYMNMAVILVAIVGFGVIKRSGITIKLQLQHNIVSYMESIRWCPMCFVTDKYNTILLWASFGYWQTIYFKSLCGNNSTQCSEERL